MQNCIWLQFDLPWINWYLNCWRKNKCSEGTSTVLPQHDPPRAVLACAVLVGSSAYSGPPARLSIPVTFYVQTKKKHTSGSVDQQWKRLDAWAQQTLWEPQVRRRHAQTCAMGGSANILEAGVEQRGLQSQTGDCPILLSDHASDHDFYWLLWVRS